MNKNILITGGCGFIGSEAVRKLIQKGFNIYNFDKLTYASCEESLTGIDDSKYVFFEGDLFNRDDIIDFFKEAQPTYILNFAAESHVDKSIEGPIDFINTNIIGTYNLLEVSLNYFSNLSIEMKRAFRFIHISTDEVYGSLDFDDNSFTENSPYQPNSPYSASKASSDLLVRAWGKTYNLPFNITHGSNNYGPWQFPEKLIPLTVKNALSERPIQIYGDGLNIRDWIHVSDHVDAIIEVMLNGSKGETYNIGSNNEFTNLEIVNLICRTLDELTPRNEAKYSDLIEFIDDRPGHDLRYAVCVDKIVSKLSWSPKVEFSEGIVNSVKWMLSNKDWLLSKSDASSRLDVKK